MGCRLWNIRYTGSELTDNIQQGWKHPGLSRGNVTDVLPLLPGFLNTCSRNQAGHTGLPTRGWGFTPDEAGKAVSKFNKNSVEPPSYFSKGSKMSVDAATTGDPSLEVAELELERLPLSDNLPRPSNQKHNEDWKLHRAGYFGEYHQVRGR